MADELAAVEQCDRDAAARFISNDGLRYRTATDIELGRQDQGRLVQAFARHRLSTRPKETPTEQGEVAALAHAMMLRARELDEWPFKDSADIRLVLPALAEVALSHPVANMQVAEAAYREGYDQGLADGEKHHIPDDAWRVSHTRSTITASSEDASPWSDYHGGTSLSFEPGVFNLNRSGSASIAVHEGEVEWETDDESGKTYVVMNLPVGEAEAIRDWLNKWLPVPSTITASTTERNGE